MNLSERPRRSEATKAAILNAARERFASDGYERATIRAIAADAGIDPAMVIRYFTNKERLFAAAAEFDLYLPDLEMSDLNDVGEALVRHFVGRWEGDDTLLALLRASVTNDAAADRMREIFADQLAPMVALLSKARTPEEVAVRAGLVAAQILGLALCRYVLRIQPIAALSQEELVRWLGPTLQRYLTEE